MKKLISLCLALIMVLSMSFVCFAAEEKGYLFEDNFNGYSIGNLPFGTPNKWNNYNDRQFTQWTPRVAVDPKDSQNHVLAIDKHTAAEDSTKNQHLITLQELISGDIEVTFRFYIPSNEKTAGGNTYNSTTSDTNQIEVSIVDSQVATTILHKVKINPNKATLESIGSGSVLSKDNWHSVRMTVNTETGVVATYVNGKLQNNVKEDASIKGKSTKELRIVVTGKLPESLVYVDDIKVEKKVKPWYYKLNKAYYSQNNAFISAPAAGETLKSISMEKSSVASGNNLLIAAYYNQYGDMKTAKMVPLSANDFDANGKANITVDMDFPASQSDVTGGTLKVFTWGSIGNMIPLVEPYIPSDTAKTPKLYLVGDSTMVAYKNKDFPRAGIGQMLEGYVSGIDVVNHGSSGKDTADYLEYSGWTTILNNAKMGDYVIIQLGINDRLHDIGTDVFLANLTIMTDTLLEKGVNVILNTPTIRRVFDSDGNFKATFDENGKFITTDVFTSDKGDYYATIKSFIEERKGTPGFFSIDMTAITAEITGKDAAFDDDSRQCYMQDVFYNWDEVYAKDSRAEISIYADKEGTNYKTCEGDFTHLTMYGADVIAQKMAQEIKKLNIPLSDYIVNTTKTITYPNFSYTYAE